MGNKYRAATSVFFAGIDPRERLEFIGWGQVFYGVELELGFKVICWSKDRIASFKFGSIL